ncbi:hypothetical protein CPB83DRAFT_907020 [Crepidotus variabilis]|uniref:Uncharacterized protein n=1 Tax=Crepidotus variabilis TaxID=179855 RepID=A0A9P6EG66_9AGAR|nr:hypothetical protein CPB83DRAFT_907020 [Crepidotus variabilis]
MSLRRSLRNKLTPDEDPTLDLTVEELPKKGKRGRADTTSTATSALKKSKKNEPVEQNTMDVGENSEEHKDVGEKIESKPHRTCATATAVPKTRTRVTTEQRKRLDEEYNIKVDQLVSIGHAGKKFLAAIELKQAENEQLENEQAVMNLNQQEKKPKTIQLTPNQLAKKLQNLSNEDYQNLVLKFLGGSDGLDEPNGMAIDSDSSEESNEDNDLQRPKKPKRGETRKAVNDLKADMREGSKKAVETMAVEKKKADTSNLKIMKRSVSGVNPAWLAKATPIRVQASSSKKKPKPTSEESDSEIEILGGLNDEDIISSRPIPVKHRKGKDVYENVVKMDSSDSEPIPTAIKTKGKAAAKKQAPNVKREKKVKVKTEFLPPTPSVNPNVVPAFLNQGAKNGLWQMHFLPTLFHKLYASSNPFNEFASNTDSLSQAVAKCLDDAAPGHTYVLPQGSIVVSMAYDRLTDKRSLFGSNAIKVVDDFFKQSQFDKNPDAVKMYVAYALHAFGPAFWSVPKTRKADGEVDDASRPQGLYESDLFIQTIAPIVTGTKGSCGDYGELIGAIGLGGAALERAFTLYETGSRPTEIPRDMTFSNKYYGHVVFGHIKDAKKLSENAWSRIKAACAKESGEADIQVKPAPPVMQSMEQQRGNLHIPSSPPGGH